MIENQVENSMLFYDCDGITIYNARCEDVLPSIDSADVGLLLSDPPYGIGHTASGVSSHDQRASLDGQVSRTVQAASKLGLAVDEVVVEVGSGTDGQRRKLSRLLSDPQITCVVVEHRDRLARFGVHASGSGTVGIWTPDRGRGRTRNRR